MILSYNVTSAEIDPTQKHFNKRELKFIVFGGFQIELKSNRLLLLIGL